MAQVHILIPTPLRKFTDDQDRVEAEGATVLAAFEDLIDRYPDLRKQIAEPDREDVVLRRFVNVFLNGTDIRMQSDGIKTELREGDEISIIPAIAGG